MGEKKRRERRTKESVKPTEKLSSFDEINDEQVSQKQIEFCLELIDSLLSDDSAVSFSKPVSELWDESITQDYFERIKNPMDLGTVKTNLVNNKFIYTNSKLFNANLFRHDLRLVFLNALEYNAKGTDLARFATKFCHYVDNQFQSLPNKIDQNNHSNQKDNHDDEDPMDLSGDEDDQQNQQQIESKSKSDKKKSKQYLEQDADLTDAADGTASKDEQTPQDDHDNLQQKINSLQKDRNRLKTVLDQLEKEDASHSLTYEENAKLRDEIEALPWEKVQKVVNLLKEYVDEALTKTDEHNPEFVTLEFSSIEPKLLNRIKRVVHPDAKIEKERKSIANIDDEISSLKRKLRRLGEHEESGRKKRRKS